MRHARTVRFARAGIRLDAGGIAKGYAADRALEEIAATGLSQALVAAGGDLALGQPPPGRAGWEVTLAGLDADRGAPGSPIVVARCGVSTSGDAEQWVEIGGVRYSHIIDPRTGIALMGRRSVSVIARDATSSDMLATALSVLGPDEGARVIARYRHAAALVGTRSTHGDQLDTHEGLECPCGSPVSARVARAAVVEAGLEPRANSWRSFMSRTILAAFIAAFAAAASLGAADAPNTLTDKEKADGWKLLFDGKTTNGWHGYNQKGMPEGWAVKDGALTRVAKTTDIVSDEEFENFELQFDWKLAKNGNSGLFFHVVESPKYKEVYFTGPEFQLLDNDGPPRRQERPRSLRRRQLRAARADAEHGARARRVEPVAAWSSTTGTSSTG